MFLLIQVEYYILGALTTATDRDENSNKVCFAVYRQKQNSNNQLRQEAEEVQYRVFVKVNTAGASEAHFPNKFSNASCLHSEK